MKDPEMPDTELNDLKGSQIEGFDVKRVNSRNSKLNEIS